MLRKLVIFLTGICVVAGILILTVRHFYQTGALQEMILNKAVEKVAESHNISATTTQQSVQLIKRLLGFSSPQNYLVLFLNNTELRPGGGFIGTYAVVHVENGIPHILKVEGTEVLDNYAPQDYPSVPPQPIIDYLKVKRWGFRDSNWSPDFVVSSNKALELYKKERGLKANEITSVLGITPTVIEELLKITGPITVGGEEFTSDNFTQKIEYQVEYGYVDQGIERVDRKNMLGDLTRVLISRLQDDIFKQWPKYLEVVENMLAQKHIIMFSVTDPHEQEILSLKQWSGEMSTTTGDYLLWVDANLGAWKTDASLERNLTYSLSSTGSQFIAEVRMKYKHVGVIDWRTSNYRTYARVYVPVGSRLITVSNHLKNIPVDQGVEQGREWFGTFTTVSPGESTELVFRYYVSPEIVSAIRQGTYQLRVQKQIGTIKHGLTLALEFGSKVVFATPGESPSAYGDNRYDIKTDLEIDRDFLIKTENH